MSNNKKELYISNFQLPKNCNCNSSNKTNILWRDPHEEEKFHMHCLEATLTWDKNKSIKVEDFFFFKLIKPEYIPIFTPK